MGEHRPLQLRCAQVLRPTHGSIRRAPIWVGLGRGGVLPQAAANDSHPLHRIAKHLNSSADPSKARFYHQFCFHGRHGLCHELCCAAISYDARRCEWRLARPAVAA